MLVVVGRSWWTGRSARDAGDRLRERRFLRRHHRKTASGHDLVAWNGHDNSSKFSDAPTATLHIKRVANTLTVEGTAGTVTQSFDTAYPDLPVTIGLFAECPFEFPGEAVISKFTLTGGAPGKSDDFDCDSRK